MFIITSLYEIKCITLFKVLSKLFFSKLDKKILLLYEFDNRNRIVPIYNRNTTLFNTNFFELETKPISDSLNYNILVSIFTMSTETTCHH